jgi:hypothetical protein
MMQETCITQINSNANSESDILCVHRTCFLKTSFKFIRPKISPRPASMSNYIQMARFQNALTKFCFMSLPSSSNFSFKRELRLNLQNRLFPFESPYPQRNPSIFIYIFLYVCFRQPQNELETQAGCLNFALSTDSPTSYHLSISSCIY